MFPKRVHLFYMVLTAAASSFIARADEDRSLDDVLKHWQQSASRVRRLDCRYRRFEYQDALGVERRAQGTIAIESPQRAAIIIDEPTSRNETASRKKDAQGVPYSVEQEPPSCMVWVPGDVVRVDARAGTFRRLKTEENSSLAQFPLAGRLLFGAGMGDLREEFEIRLVNQTNREIWISLTPRPREPAAMPSFSEAKLILDSETFLPKAVMLRSAASKRDSTVFTFHDIRLNQRAAANDPLALNLEQLREEK